MPEHVAIVDPQIHEPKGISTALIDQLYVADGSGSGSWRISPAQLSSLVNVETAADFPPASGNIRILADNTAYRVGQSVSIGADRIVFGNNSRIVGIDRLISSISSTTTSPLFTANNNALNISDINISNPNGALFDFTDGATNPIIIERVTSSSFLTVGSFANASFGIIDSCNFIGGSNQLSFTGSTTVGSFGIFRTGFSGYSGFAFNLGTAILNIITLSGNSFSGLGGSTSINGTTTSGNINTRGIISGCNFNGAGTAEAGISVTDLLWERQSNYGLESTQEILGLSWTANTAATVISTASTPVKVNSGGLSSSYVANRFTSDASGTLTYVGLEDITLSSIFNISADTASGTNNVYNFYITVNGTPITQSKVAVSLDSADPETIGILSAVSLVTGDTVELWVESITHTIDITISDAHGLSK